MLLMGLLLVILAACSPGDEDGQGQTDEQIPPESTTEEEASTVASQMGKLEAKAEMKNTENENVGEVLFYLNDQGLTVVEANIENLEQGYRGFHIHENAACDPDASDGPFTTAGGHYHGEDEGHGHHTGDMPSLYVNENGTAQMIAVIDGFVPEELLNSDTAVIIHEGPDNFANIPDRYQSSEQEESGPDQATLNTGDAGDRAACGVVSVVE